MLDRVLTNREVLRKWLKAGVVHQGRFSPTDEGTPQGGVISPTLANCVLNGLETGLAAHLNARLGVVKARRAKVNVVRYADDFVCGFNDEKDALRFLEWLKAQLKVYGLELAKEKSGVVKFSRFDIEGLSLIHI